VVALLGVAPCPAGGHGRLFGIPDHRGMDFTQINTHDIVSWCWSGVLAVFDHDMPGRAPGLPVIDQAAFPDPPHIGRTFRTPLEPLDSILVIF
jgi:hypothetical protein